VFFTGNDVIEEQESGVFYLYIALFEAANKDGALVVEIA
jgi:hypothetical protein